MTTNKPNVRRYDDMGSGQICPINNMYESDDGDYVLYEDYEALQAECERLRKDAERLNFITQRPGWLHSRKGWWGCVNPFTNYSYPMFKTPRDAIDSAMEEDVAT